MTAHIAMICHASTDAVRRALFPRDEPLDDQGSGRAAALAKHVPTSSRCWTSPELRSRQTAAALQLDAIVEPRLCDCDYGNWAGLSFDEVFAREPEAVADWLRDPEVSPHGGESILELMRRVDSWLDEQSGVTGRSIVVTHPAIIRAAIVHVIEAAPKSFWRVDIAPLSLTCFTGHNGRWNLTLLGKMMSRQL